MGIRVHCPNGHKLNVKAFLAGKIGVCPHCGSKFAIPMQADAGGGDPTASVIIRSEGSRSGEAPSQAALEAALAISNHVSSNHAPAAGAPEIGDIRISTAAAQASPPVAAAVAVGPAPVAEPAGLSSALAAIPLAMPVSQRTALPAAQPVVPDPIAEAPQALWYVRPAGGEQYGPAPGATLRQWIEQGRVGPDSLVWREGWPEWKPAASVFAQLRNAAAAIAVGPAIAPAGPAPAPAVGPSPVGPDGAWSSIKVGPAAPSVAQAYAGARRKSNLSLLAMIVFLVLLVIVLATVFVVVLRKQDQDTPRKDVERIDAAAPRTRDVYEQLSFVPPTPKDFS